MTRLSKIIFIFCCLLLIGEVSGQSLDKLDDSELVGVRTPNMRTVGLRLYSNGWAITAQRGRDFGAKKYQFLQAEIASINHAKEVRQNRLTAGSPGDNRYKAYKLGKQNYFYAMRFNVGQRLLLGEKAYKNGVEATLTYSVGPSLGVTVPYYLNLSHQEGDGYIESEQRYSEENQWLFLNQATIQGKSSFFKGFKELGLIPGGHAKLGLNFDWAAINDKISSIEVGFTADVYAKRIPLMVPVPDNTINSPFFISAYVSMHLGKKW